MIQKITPMDRIKFRLKQFASDKEDVIQEAEWEESQEEDFRTSKERDIWETSYLMYELALDEAVWLEISIWRLLWEVIKRAVFDCFDVF